MYPILSNFFVLSSERTLPRKKLRKIISGFFGHIFLPLVFNIYYNHLNTKFKHFHNLKQVSFNLPPNILITIILICIVIINPELHNRMFVRMSNNV